MFYCSNDPRVSVVELRPHAGSHIVLSCWETTKELTLNRVGYTNQTFTALSSDRKCPEWGPAVPPGAGPASSLINEFLAREFTLDVAEDQDYLYKISIAITETLIGQKVVRTDGTSYMFDGLLYPTVAMQANADNLALTPECADRHLRFVWAQHALIQKLVTSTAYPGYEAAVLDFSTSLSPTGVLNWQGRPPQRPTEAWLLDAW